MNNECVSENLGDYTVVWLRGEVGVELSEVSYIDSSGIAALVEGLQNAKSKGKQFGLVAVSNAVMAVLQLARLDRVFTIFPDLDAARAG